MQELEKILEEIQKVKEIMLSPTNVDCFGEPCRENDCLACVVNKCMEIVQKHMSDGWIPVEKRLPDVGERIIVCNEKGFRCEAMMTEKGKYFRYGLELGELFGQKIVAWRPLPEPYQPESKEPEERKEWKERILRDFMKKGER